MTGFAMGPFGPLFEAGPGARKISTGVFNAKYVKAAEDRLLGDRRDRSRQCHALDPRAGARRWWRWWRRRRTRRGGGGRAGGGRGRGGVWGARRMGGRRGGGRA